MLLLILLITDEVFSLRSVFAFSTCILLSNAAFVLISNISLRFSSNNRVFSSDAFALSSINSFSRACFFFFPPRHIVFFQPSLQVRAFLSLD